MKKTAAFVILFLFALLAWKVFTYSGDMVFDVDGERFDGPLGALLAVIFASVGIVLVGALGLGAVALALAISPLLLPVLLPLAVIWYLASRSRKQRMVRGQAV